MKKINKGTVRKVLRYTGRHNALILLSLLLSVICVACNLCIPVFAGRAIDAIHGSGNIDKDTLIKNLILILAAAGISALVQWIVNTLNNSVAFRVVRDLRNAAIRKISVLPISYIDSHPAGDIVSRGGISIMLR